AVPLDFMTPADLTPLPPPDLADTSHGPGADVAENVLTDWDVADAVGDAIEACRPVNRGSIMLVADANMVRAGKQSVRVAYGPDQSYYFEALYPKARNAGWDLSTRAGVALS